MRGPSGWGSLPTPMMPTASRSGSAQAVHVTLEEMSRADQRLCGPASSRFRHRFRPRRSKEFLPISWPARSRRSSCSRSRSRSRNLRSAGLEWRLGRVPLPGFVRNLCPQPGPRTGAEAGQWGPSGQPAADGSGRIQYRAEPHAGRDRRSCGARVYRGIAVPSAAGAAGDSVASRPPRRISARFATAAPSTCRRCRVRAGSRSLPDKSELVCLASRVAGTLFHPKVVLI